MVVREASVSKSPAARDAEARRDAAEEDARYVGRAIEIERSKARLTQGDLAQLSGVSQPHISSIEKGTWSPKLNTVMLIAEALGVDVNALLPPSRRDESYKS
jgi:transcriptional regulator with XRE-family HTH domain